MTLNDVFEMIDRNETPDQFKARRQKLRRYANERDDLIDAIDVLKNDVDRVDQFNKKIARLKKVESMINELK